MADEKLRRRLETEIHESLTDEAWDYIRRHVLHGQSIRNEQIQLVADAMKIARLQYGLKAERRRARRHPAKRGQYKKRANLFLLRLLQAYERIQDTTPNVVAKCKNREIVREMARYGLGGISSHETMGRYLRRARKARLKLLRPCHPLADAWVLAVREAGHEAGYSDERIARDLAEKVLQAGSILRKVKEPPA